MKEICIIIILQVHSLKAEEEEHLKHAVFKEAVAGYQH